MKKFGIIMWIVLITGFIPVVESEIPFLTQPGYVYAEDDWKAEFEDICSKTNDAMTLTKEEINSLVSRCDKLKPRIEKIDETQKKVYLKRLQMCKDLFIFVLESKEKK